MDEITEAVLARHEVARYLSGSHGLERRRGARARHHLSRRAAHDAALRAVSRARISALPDSAQDRTHRREHVGGRSTRRARYRVVYASNHRSHIDYLVEPLVLDDAGIRPPIIAAGINLFGGPLGLIHKHVTGAMPIRRNTKDPAYLITLKAYVAELLRKHDLFFYPEGGRSYSGELKASKTGLFSAALQAGVPEPRDPADRDRLRPRARGSHPVAAGREAAAAAVHAASWPRWCALPSAIAAARSSRFGRADSASTAIDHSSRRSVLDLAHLVRARVGRLYKVLPTALVAAAMRPSITRAGAHRPDRFAARHAARRSAPTWPCTSGEAAVEAAAEPFEARGIIVVEDGPLPRARAPRAALLRTIDSSTCSRPAGPTH